MTSEMGSLLDALAALPADWHGAGCLEMPNLAALARHATARRIRCSMETGSGKTTLLMSQVSARHLVFSLNLGDSLAQARTNGLLRRDAVEFIDGPSQQTLLAHTFTEPLQLAILDGPHGFPFPNLEYWKVYPHLEPGGVLMIDDIHIPTIRHLFDFVNEDPMFALLEVVGKTAFFERTTTPTFSPIEDGWWLQPYNTRRFPVRHPVSTPLTPAAPDAAAGDAAVDAADRMRTSHASHAYRARLLPLIARWTREQTRVAIFGIGGHTDFLFDVVPELATLRLVAFLDTSPARRGTRYRGIDVQPPSWTPGRADVVLCSSYEHELTQLSLLDEVPVKAVLSHAP